MQLSTLLPRIPRLLCVVACCIFYSCQINAINAEQPPGFLNQGPQTAGGVQDAVRNTQIVERSSTDIISQTRSLSDVRGDLQQGPGVKNVVFPAHGTTGIERDLDIRHVTLDPGNLVGKERYMLEEKISVIYPGTKQHLMIKQEHQVATISPAYLHSAPAP